MKKKKYPIYSYLSASAVRPTGWLYKQLRIQAEGLSGHLDLIWPDVRDSKWIGGNREGWERVPYWLDGFIPLAFLLDDDELKARAKRYIDAIFDGQEEDGWICPCEKEERQGYDVWAAFLILKVLVEWHETTGDERVEPAVEKALRQLLGHIKSVIMFGWATSRWFECLIPINWLFARKPEPWLEEMAFTLSAYGLDYERLWRGTDPGTVEPEKYWLHLSHVVNTAMALKSRAVMSPFTGEDPDNFAKFMFKKLNRLHGSATGHFSGDECLSGTSPIRGTELCSIVEAMYSYEELMRIGGNAYWGDRLEEAAYNDLATAISADMNSHQYDRMINQVNCSPIEEGKQPFSSNGGGAHMFGLEPNYGCCTANFNQGWPKFARSAIMKYKKGYAVAALCPVSITDSYKGKDINIAVDTEYPFRDQIKVIVGVSKLVKFVLKIRVPASAEKALLITPDGKTEVNPGSFAKIDRKWKDQDTIELKLKFKPKLILRPSGMYCVRRGPLFYSLPIESEAKMLEYESNGVERKFPFCDWIITPASEWGFGFASSKFEKMEHPMPDVPFDREDPPVSLETWMYPLDWREYNGVCSIYPESETPIGEKRRIKLVPFGCTTLRMTEMPLIKQELENELV